MTEENMPAAIEGRPAEGAPAGERQAWPSWKQAIIVFVGSFVLALSSCFGMIVSFDMNQYRNFEGPLMAVSSIVFVLSLLGLLVGGVMVLMRLLRALFGASKAQSQNAGTSPRGPQS